MTNPSAGDTVISTKSSGNFCVQSKRKRRRLEPLTRNAEIPEKTQRREDQLQSHTAALAHSLEIANLKNENDTNRSRSETDATYYTKPRWNRDTTITERGTSKNSTDKATQQQDSRKPITVPVRDEGARLRKTIQWLEEGSRRLREDLATARTELHEERRAAKVTRRKTEAAVREARAAEAAKYQLIIVELKAKLSRASPVENSSVAYQASVAAAKAEFIREEHHKREISGLKKRLSEAEGTVRRLKWESLNLQTKSPCKPCGSFCPEVRRLEVELRNLRATNEKLEEKLRVAQEAEKARIAELRIQHENHEAELSSLRKTLRTETMKMMDELRVKNREIEKLSKLRQAEGQRKRKKTTTTTTTMKDDAPMRKLRDNERTGPIRSASRMGKKFLLDDAHTMDSYVPEKDCDRVTNGIEVERLRELALEQQEVIEILRQAVKEKERKLEQLSNKRRKEEFYRQWLELEPVAEVEDEEDHEEGDSALSSGPSSLSPQPGACGLWQGNDVTREAYEAVLLEVEELQTKLLHERQELQVAKSHARDLEKALLQESRCDSHNAELNAIAEKLCATEEREATLLVELSELREQNELLEFRLLELEEMSARRGSPDRTVDSGIVSPEPLHTNKDQLNKHRNRAIATVIPYTNSASLNRSISPIPHKPPLSLQESGIFEEEVEDEDELEVELASRGTQTEPPAGELLQEVQRLQELRVRIQERAAKVANPMICPVEQSRIVPGLDTVSDVPVESIVQLSSYQERVRELEERLETREKELSKRLQEKEVSKQREEELLDENYRLTERVYWLESEIKHTRTNRETGVNSSAMEIEDSGVEMEKIEAREEDDLNCIVREESKLDDLRNKEFTLEVESYETFNSSKAVQTEIGLSSQLNCPVCKNHAPVAQDTDSTRWRAQEAKDLIMIGGEVDKESIKQKEEEEEEEEEEDKTASDESMDDVDSGTGSLPRLTDNISQVLVVPEEAASFTKTPLESTVSLVDPDPEKKDNTAGATWCAQVTIRNGTS